MYQRSNAQNITNLVTLEMAYHMPVDLRGQSRIARLLTKLSNLNGNLFQLLDPVFTKVGKAQTNNFLYGIDCGRFGNNDKLYPAWVSADPAAGTVNGLFYVL